MERCIVIRAGTPYASEQSRERCSPAFLSRHPPQIVGGATVAVSILIVDDNKSVRCALRLFLTAHRFRICAEAADGSEAIEHARRLNPDVVVLDFAMPGLNGLDTARVLASACPDLPVIMFTSHASRALETQAQALGIRAVLSKTDGLDLLVEEIRKLPARNGRRRNDAKYTTADVKGPSRSTRGPSR